MRDRIRSALAGRYVLEREIGRGASATVYSARDLKHGRRVALKVLDPAIASTIGHERFLREIRTTATLNHPHILPLFDSDETDGFVFYTMPLVEGESLRDRMKRSGPMPLDVVRKLAAQIAEALTAAHAAGVVHRDIKPENILVTAQDHVWVCDFGLARALASAIDGEASAAALIIGSPQYMSPEQASGRQDVDTRSDVYSLACTVFEMLAGTPPFADQDAVSLLRRHLTEPPPPVRSLREDVPSSVDRALQQALAKSRDQRFADARAFAAALEDAEHPRLPVAVQPEPPARPRRPRRAATIAALTAAALIPLAWLFAQDPMNWLGHGGVEADTSLFVILPLEREQGLAQQHEEQHIRDALVRWTDVRVVDGFQLSDALARRGADALSLSESREVARELQAGRLIRGSVSRRGDSLVVRTALFGVAGGRRPLSEYDVRIPADGSDAQHAYLRLVDALLFKSTGGNLTTAHASTTSRRARHAYLAAERAMWEWDLAVADSLLSAALHQDPDYPEALLLRAQIRFWLEGPGELSQRAAEAAAAAADRLPGYERRMADGLLSLARGDYPAACAVYDEMLRDNPRDFIAARGMADCHQFDRLVIRDPASPTGWSFRSSGHQALQYHIRAFRLVPASHRAFRAGRFLRLREDIFFTALAAFRRGTSETGEPFRARPSWNDTLAFHPRPVSEIALDDDIEDSAVTAVTELRRTFFDVTLGWVTAYPQSSDALEAHAIAMELKGDARAIETLERARAFTRDPEHRLHLSISEFWLRLKRALPEPIGAVRATRELADSLMQYEGPLDATTAARLSAVAAVTGRAHRAASLARVAAQTSTRPPRVVQARDVLLAYAAVGGPADSIAHYEAAVDAAIRNLLSKDEAESARAEMLGRAAPLALPEYRMKFIGADRLEDFMLDAIELLLEGRHDSVRHVLAGVAQSRAHARPADIMLEGLLPEAWLLTQMNDMEAAAARIGPTLDDIVWVEPGGLERVAAAGSLARAMLLRAQTAHAIGDRTTARRWAAAFAELWRNADEELQPRVREARRILE